MVTTEEKSSEVGEHEDEKYMEEDEDEDEHEERDETEEDRELEEEEEMVNIEEREVETEEEEGEGNSLSIPSDKSRRRGRPPRKKSKKVGGGLTLDSSNTKYIGNATRILKEKLSVADNLHALAMKRKGKISRCEKVTAAVGRYSILIDIDSSDTTNLFIFLHLMVGSFFLPLLLFFKTAAAEEGVKGT